MKTLSKFLAAATIGACVLSGYPSAIHAKDVSNTEERAPFSSYPSPIQPKDMSSIENRVATLEKRLNLVELDEVVYGPITVHNIHLSNSKHFLMVPPGKTIECSFKYKLDSSQQEFLNVNHLLVGLKGVAGEVCATHLYGVWDSSGTAKFKIVAPLEEGDYDVRIAYLPGKTCEEALASWNVLKYEPGDSATIGILSVRRGPINF